MLNSKFVSSSWFSPHSLVCLSPMPSSANCSRSHRHARPASRPWRWPTAPRSFSSPELCSHAGHALVFTLVFAAKFPCFPRPASLHAGASARAAPSIACARQNRHHQGFVFVCFARSPRVSSCDGVRDFRFLAPLHGIPTREWAIQCIYNLA